MGDDSGVSGRVLTVVSTMDNNILCFAGHASGLEGGLESFLQNGTDCNVANGCGTHIHGGTSCDNATTQAGHWYNNATEEMDPWALLGYLETTSEGIAMYGTCVNVGFPPGDAIDKPFIVHASDGTRVACGILQHDSHGDGDMNMTIPTSNANRRDMVVMLFGFLVVAVALLWW